MFTIIIFLIIVTVKCTYLYFWAIWGLTILYNILSNWTYKKNYVECLVGWNNSVAFCVAIATKKS